MSEPLYKTYNYLMQCRGIVARYVVDKLPDGTFLNMLNWEVRQENSISSRLGRVAINTDGSSANYPIGNNVNAVWGLGRLKALSDPSSGTPAAYRYAVSADGIFRSTNGGIGQFSNILGAGKRVSGPVTGIQGYRFSGSATPYLMFADNGGMYKDNGTNANAQTLGCYPPTMYCKATAQPPENVLINQFAVDSFSYSNVALHSIGNLINTTLGTAVAGGADAVVTPASMANITNGIVLQVDSEFVVAIGVTATTFGAYFSKAHGSTATVIGTNLSAGTKVNTTIGSMAAGYPTVVTPASMANISPGMVLRVANGTGLNGNGNGENIVVISTTATTFTAAFYYLHASSDAITDENVVVNGRVNTTMGTSVAANTIATVTPPTMSNIVVGQTLLIDSGASQEVVVVLGTTTTSFTAYFQLAHPSGATVVDKGLEVSIAAGSDTIATISHAAAPGGGNLDLSGYQQFKGATNNQVVVWLNLSNPGAIDSLVLSFTVTDPTHTLTGTYSYTFDLSGFTSGVWTEVSIPQGKFVPGGTAGAGSYWNITTNWTLTASVNSNGPAVFGIDNLYLTSGPGPDSTGGSFYDWRATFYDLATGSESNPNQVMATPIKLIRQPTIVLLPSTTDPQFTHTRLYRRGGSLTNGWYLVAQVPINTASFTDDMADIDISGQPMLVLDNDPPLTTLLRQPVNTTITDFTPVTLASTVGIYPYSQITVGTGATQEVVTVIAVNYATGVISANFQYLHSVGETVTATARMGQNVNIFTIAFDQGWYAGDDDNPHFLYYSKRFNPEAVPPQNYIEVGTPSDPITGIFEFRSQLYVFTVSTIYNILGANIPGASIFPVKTQISHGMIFPYLFTVTDEAVYYVSSDGVWAFRGSNGMYASAEIEGLFSGQNPGEIVGLQNNSASSVRCIEFFENEVFISYKGTDGNGYRAIWNTQYKRWRNDDVNASAMLNERDVYTMLMARVSPQGNMLYLDRTGDVDTDGYYGGQQIVTPINLNLLSVYQDQGAPAFQKSYQNVMLDIDTNGQELTASLGLNNGTLAPLALTTVAQTGRAKVQKTINGGSGQVAYNAAFQVMGTVTSKVTIYEAAVESTLEAKVRQAFDSYWLKDGTDEYKLQKQGWFEYVAPDAAGLTVSFYIDGSSTPVYTTNLPKATIRTAKWRRFPAIKYKLRRIIITSASDFMLYDTSHVEVKPLCGGKGYSKSNLGVNQ